MRNFIFFSLFLSLSSLTRADNHSRLLSCSFTEPFYNLELDLDSGRLVKKEFDWDDKNPDSDYIETVLETKSQVSVSSTGRSITIEVKKLKNNNRILNAQLDFQGSNDMSNTLYPLSGQHFDPKHGTQRGGCELSKVSAYAPELLDSNMKKFATYADHAISLCFGRATAEWTTDPSDFAPDSTKFFVLYSQRPVPGEKGEISQTFSSAENEELYKLLLQTQVPPEDGASLNHLKANMWNYCSAYSERLQDRYIK